MTIVQVQCPAKTNLTLHVGARHEEWGGRHALETVYCAIGLYDTVIVTGKHPGAGFSLELAGQHLGDLASSASDMRRGIRIEKNIPVGAGLGGGSADAAGTLLALNELWGLHWPVERLSPIAATLGADMPFCLRGGTALGTGFGERIEPLAEDDARMQALRASGCTGRVLVGAYRAQLSTPEVYAAFDVLGPGGGPNDLQQAAISLHPRSGVAVDAALGAGASAAFVSGSGPSVVAFAPDELAAQAVQRAWLQADAVDRITLADAPAQPIVRVQAA